MSLPRWIDGRVTVGNIITILMMVAGAVVWGNRQEATAASHADRIHRLETEDARIRLEVREVREKADAKLELLTRDMGEVRASLRGISTNIDWIVRQSGKDARAPP